MLLRLYTFYVFIIHPLSSHDVGHINPLFVIRVDFGTSTVGTKRKFLNEISVVKAFTPSNLLSSVYGIHLSRTQRRQKNEAFANIWLGSEWDHKCLMFNVVVSMSCRDGTMSVVDKACGWDGLSFH